MKNNERLQIFKPIANAMFDIAKEKEAVNQIYDELKECNQLFKDKDINRYFFDDTISKKDKMSIVEKKLKSIFSDEIFNFINILIEHNIIDALDDIVKLYGEIVDEHNNTVKVKICSAYEIDDKVVKNIIDTIKSLSNKKIDYSIEIDNTLIGGIIVNIGSTVYDYSIKNQINVMQNKFINSYN